mmetsp:Transcript_20269/g.31273  ORF Transcript_20269/g.31273 Transcript_20269/m.31273 type:complete len:389 (-) Transcript_20269:17-1183(-)
MSIFRALGRLRSMFQFKPDIKERNIIKFLLRAFVLPSSILVYVLHAFVRWLVENGDSDVSQRAVVCLCAIGTFTCVQHLFRLFLNLRRRVLSCSHVSRPLVERYGKWAVVTGATGGIGASFCDILASEHGMCILAIGRNEEKLAELQRGIQERTGGTIEVERLVRDFAATDRDAADAFVRELERWASSKAGDGGVGLLVHGAGITYDLPETFHTLDRAYIDTMVDVNLRGVLHVSRCLLPSMVGAGRGGMINVSSACVRNPAPLLSLYAATKAAGHAFCTSLHYELDTIDVLSVTPYYFVSNMYKRKRGTVLAPMPDRIVRDSLTVIGRRDAHEAFPYWFHGLMGYIAKIYHDTPRGWLGIMTRSRARAMAKRGAKEANSTTDNSKKE